MLLYSQSDDNINEFIQLQVTSPGDEVRYKKWKAIKFSGFNKHRKVSLFALYWGFDIFFGEVPFLKVLIALNILIDIVLKILIK